MQVSFGGTVIQRRSVPGGERRFYALPRDITTRPMIASIATNSIKDRPSSAGTVFGA
jgi:hypothetical protein